MYLNMDIYVNNYIQNSCIYIDGVNDLNIMFICPLTPYENKITINCYQYLVITYDIS